MRGPASKPRARRSHLKPCKAFQEKRLDAVARVTPASGDLAQGTTPLQSSKRPLDLASTNNSSPAKRARLTRTDAQRRPSRRSARLQGQQPANSGDSIHPSRASFGRQIEADAGTLTSERPGLTRRKIQPEAEEDEQTEQTAETVQQPKPPKRPSTSLFEARVEEQERVSRATLLRKRQIDGGDDDDDDDDDNEHQLTRARLTRNNLAEFNRMAKKKGTNKVSAPPESTVESSTTKTTSTTTSGFAIQAYKNGILDPLSSKPPENLADIRNRLAGSRTTASPPESVYEDYVDTVGGAVNEATMVVEMSGYMLKKYPMEGYQRAFNQAFTGFPKDVGFNNDLSAPQPDFIEGFRMQEYEPFPVDEYVSGAVLYKDNPRSLTLPHVAGEWEGPGKDMEEARLQSAYDGAALVYARNQALSLFMKPDPVGHAEITTFTTDGTNINFFAHFATPSEDGTLKYHQYPVTSTNLKNSHQEFKQGRRQLRNDQDHARKQSYALRDQLKGHWKQRNGGLHPITEGALLPVPDGPLEETNAGEDEAGHEMVQQPCEPTPPTSSKLERLSKHGKTSSSRPSSSKSLPPVSDYGDGSSAQKRKASLSEGSSYRSSRPKSKGKDHWEKDGESGRYFHEHSDGRITWADE